MKNKLFILVVIILVVLVALVLRVFTPKDRWVCEGGKWIKEGEPKSTMPTKECYDELSMDKEIKELSVLFNQLQGEDIDNQEELVDNGLATEANNIEEPAVVSQDIELFAPKLGEAITSPYQIRGFAKGTWFFEASFPIQLKSLDGEILAETYASAKSDWMTEAMVPFTADLNFNIEGTSEALLVLKKDNPSGLAENDAELSYKIVITK